MYDQHRSLFLFNDLTKKIIHALKYNNQFWVRRFLQPYMQEFCVRPDNAALLEATDIIIPIPLHKKKLKERGFNQSLLIAKNWQKIIKLPLEKNTLIRQLHTGTQTGLKKTERKQNLKNAFMIKNSNPIINKNILLIDDVHTTGTTLNEAARRLKNHGAKQVMALTIAIVP